MTDEMRERIARRANLHPNPLSGYSEDYPDPDEVELGEDDFDEPDALCTDCGDDVFSNDRHFVEAWERFNTFLCAGCFEERCEDDADDE